MSMNELVVDVATKLARNVVRDAAQADYTARILSALDVDALEAALAGPREDRDYEC